MRIWNDCSGGVFTTELLLVTSMVVAGVATGLATYRNAIQIELADLAAGVQSINQSFAVGGTRGPKMRTAGSQFQQNNCCEFAVGTSRLHSVRRI